jgi:16S rRNA (guanine966-N2)-methyltransferase
MRIISGKFKGRHLVSFKADHIRPTMDRVKESLFNKWMHDVDDCTFLDLFSGTGNLGIEALSRGAKHITFVEKNIKSINILKENISLLKIGSEEYDIFVKDVIAFLKNYTGPAFGLIVIDPPFTEKMAHDVMQALDSSKVFDENTKIAIEAIKQERIDMNYQNLTCYDKLDYGDKSLSFFCKN